MGVRQPVQSGISSEKERERREIARQVQHFLERGGKIHQLQGAGGQAGAITTHRPVNLEPWL